MRVALVDYGAGNLASVRKALAACGADVFTPGAASGLAGATAAVIPGVGHFAATSALDGAWRDAVRALIADGGALLGICLGQQWLFEGSTEAPDVPGLAVLPGRCAHLAELAPPAARVFTSTGQQSLDGLKVPHVGWNDVDVLRASPLLAGVRPGDQAYFTHAFAAPVTGDAVGVTRHGATFASAVQRDRVCGVQFHPEKSGSVGLAVIRNFLRMAAGR
jgi:imidazole glycerol-phosphate synthase subunit HisH